METTIFLEFEKAKNKWRSIEGSPIVIDLSDTVLSALMGVPLAEGIPVGGIVPRGVPSDIGDETLKLGFIPIRKETTIDDEGEILTLARDDAEHEVESWGCVTIKEFVFFATQEDFTSLNLKEISQVIKAAELSMDSLSEEFIKVMDQMREVEKVEGRVRMILVLGEDEE